MKNIFLPSKVEYQPDPKNKNKGSVIIEPCYPGYGLTWGNTLRRVLLTSLEGAAVTAVKIKGVKYEFSALDYIQEDVLEIILNLKSLRLKIHKNLDEPVKLTLKASGEKKVKAGNIDKSADVEVVNPELLIATLTHKKAKLEMEIWAEKGYGWVPSEEKTREGLDVGMIIVDSIFSSVIKVAVKVENVRVGKRTDYDRLILVIETDGTISPLQALATSSKLLAEQFSFFVTSAEQVKVSAAKKKAPKKKKVAKKKTAKKKTISKKKTAPKKKTAKKKTKKKPAAKKKAAVKKKTAPKKKTKK